MYLATDRKRVLRYRNETSVSIHNSCHLLQQETNPGIHTRPGHQALFFSAKLPFPRQRAAPQPRAALEAETQRLFESATCCHGRLFQPLSQDLRSLRVPDMIWLISCRIPSRPACSEVGPPTRTGSLSPVSRTVRLGGDLEAESRAIVTPRSGRQAEYSIRF